MSKRSLIAKALHRVGLADAVLRARRRLPSPWLTILTYHRVAPTQTGHLFDDGVVDASPQGFEAQLALVREYFTPLRLADVLGYLGGGALPANPLLITFDDGYKDNVTTALPILERHGVPATFFVTTDYITERRVFWWDRIAYVIKKSPAPVLNLTYPDVLRLPLDDARDRERATHALAQIVKRRYALDLDRFLDELSAAAQVPWSTELDRRLADELLMTWDDVRALKRAGMDIGSHTRTHRVLQTLPDDRLDFELRGSREILERELSAPIQTLSFPVGREIGRNPRIRAALEASGYTASFSNASGVQRLGRRLERFNLSRIAMDWCLSIEELTSFLAVPGLQWSDRPGSVTWTQAPHPTT